MDITQAKQVMLRTHTSALSLGQRANGIELMSGPGIGKSDGTFQYNIELAREINEPVGIVTFMLATISSVDVRGFMLPVKSATGLDTTFSTPPWYPVKANTVVIEPDGTVHAEGTWSGEMPRVGTLFLDEFGQADDEVKKAAAELVYKGQVGTTHLPPGWRVVAASNRMSDRSGVVRALRFITNRRMELHVDARLPAWLNWANGQKPENRPHFLTLSFAQQNPGLVFRDEVPAGHDPFCTPRTLCLMDRDLMALRTPQDIAKNTMPLDPIAREVCAGWIGAAEAAQFFTHMKYSNEIPEMSAIEKDPSNAKLPPNRDAQMVTAYMIAHNVTEKNATNVMHYVNRLQIEMQVLAVRAITQRQNQARAIVETPEFSKWLMRHKDVLIASKS